MRAKRAIPASQKREASRGAPRSLDSAENASLGMTKLSEVDSRLQRKNPNRKGREGLA